MWRASLAFVALCAGNALADDEPTHLIDDREAVGDTRQSITRQLSEEAAAIDRTLATVIDKLGLVDAGRARRLAAAYRVLAAPAGEDAMAAARRRAAARLLVDRDLAERRLLADEAAQLHTAATRSATDATLVPELVLPTSLARPARGTIARQFGTFVHERSKATLSRRGLDLEVETGRATVVAMADGVVRYAGPIRGLDAGVIIDHGSYFTILAKLGELAVPVGAPVARGDRVGRTARHRVYLEVRVKIGPGGLPIDPEPLLSSR